MVKRELAMADQTFDDTNPDDWHGAGVETVEVSGGEVWTSGSDGAADAGDSEG
jgi:hypothetical protein